LAGGEKPCACLFGFGETGRRRRRKWWWRLRRRRRGSGRKRKRGREIAQACKQRDRQMTQSMLGRHYAGQVPDRHHRLILRQLQLGALCGRLLQ